jgi:D-sedoheptulose 7-phosphate isomerase
MTTRDILIKNLNSAIDVKSQILANSDLQDVVDEVVIEMTKCLQLGGKILFCGNGGSAADAQHLAAELSGRYYKDRAPLFAEALHVNTSYLTAIANDYSFEDTYARLTEAFGREGDILVCISTSGNSENIARALNKAKELNMKTVGITGAKESKISKTADYLIQIPSTDTPRVQEGYMLIGHTICEMIETNMFE